MVCLIKLVLLSRICKKLHVSLIYFYSPICKPRLIVLPLTESSLYVYPLRTPSLFPSLSADSASVMLKLFLFFAGDLKLIVKIPVQNGGIEFAPAGRTESTAKKPLSVR